MTTHRFLPFAFCFLLFSFLATPTFASDFSFDYDIHYRVNENGVTTVENAITITNLASDLYAQNYSLAIRSDRIDGVSARDKDSTLEPLVEKKDNTTSITVPFDQKVVGKGEKFTFYLTYRSLDIASQKGRIWELIIPGIEKKPEMNTYIVRLSVPTSFGEPTYINPKPYENNTWNLDQIGDRGIIASYGTQQTFSFNLVYHLLNESNQDQYQEIALPPDTAFQKVVLERLSEIPENVTIDADGNWIAKYLIKKDEVKKVIAEGVVHIVLDPDPRFKTTLSQEETKLYTDTSQEYWLVDENLRGRIENLDSAHDIYQFVVDTLDYDYSRLTPGIERFGAVEALANPTAAVCMEFADLFVASARARGIPAREIHGYAATTNSRLQPLSLRTDVLHAWAEYFDTARGQWIPVDPTWGDTTQGVDYFSKLDFNHVVFAVLGTKSNYPYPAGSYRRDLDGKDVFVEFVTDELPLPSPVSFVDLKTPLIAISGLDFSSQLIVTNKGSVMISDTPRYKGYAEARGEDLTEISVPPYGNKQSSVRVTTPFSLLPSRQKVIFEWGGKEMQKEITLLPFYLSWQSGVVVITIGLTIFKIKKSKRFFRHPGAKR